MKKNILRYVKHVLLTSLILAVLIFLMGIWSGNHIKYAKNPLRLDINNEGPYIFKLNDSVVKINYIKGDSENGYGMKNKIVDVNKDTIIRCYYQLDSSSFSFRLRRNISTPQITYKTNSQIIALSDIEGNFKTFKDFLITHKVVDNDLNWTFDNGHLVLVGDFIDRGYFATQVLWLIYKLDYEAIKHGGRVHYILGNHEIMNMQGDHRYAPSKYDYISSILDKRQFELYDNNSVLGDWMSTKNVVEVINGNLFVHGGIPLVIAENKISLKEINETSRLNYYSKYYPKKGESLSRKLILSPETSPCWYRGYFDDNYTEEKTQILISEYKIQKVIVGHTIQSRVGLKLNNKIIGIDVEHPQDHCKSWPSKQSEGLLIDGNKYYRLLSDGSKELLD